MKGVIDGQYLEPKPVVSQGFELGPIMYTDDLHDVGKNCKTDSFSD